MASAILAVTGALTLTTTSTDDAYGAVAGPLEQP
jgi:hypothetical protein